MSSVFIFLATEALVYHHHFHCEQLYSYHRCVEGFTHKVKVSILRHLPVVGEDILGLDVVARLLLWLVVVVVLLLLRCLVGVLLVKIVHEGWTYGLLGGGVP